MAFLKNTISLLAVFCVVPAAFAATARPSIVSQTVGVSAAGAARRMPTVTNSVASGSTVTLGQSGTTSSSTSSLMDNVECIDAYTECIKSDDACGSDFSECTTNVLFHAQMPDCISTLAQCNAKGISSLFGTSDTTLLSNIETQNTDGEVTKYKYPTDGSVLGQMITAAEIANKYDTQTCVKRYMNCLHKDDVCGEDFELCTSVKEFKKQALFCDSTLARCQSAGVIELLGKYPWSPSRASDTVAGRVATEIENGADLAALNAVSTCYKVVDNCFVKACQKNPLRCIEGTSVAAMQAAQGVIGEAGLAMDTVGNADLLSASQINRYLRSSCADTIGSNKYCHMTFLGRTPTQKDLADPDYIDDVFASAHNDRKSTLTSKIQGFMQDFDKEAKGKCSDAIMKCAMRTCGSGSGAACYTQVFSDKGGKTINGEATYDEIATGCSAIANTDPNCLYAYEAVNGDAYSYEFVNDDVFETLFPESSKNSDPIGLVAALNSSLALNYNEAAIANMKKQCQSVATSCVKTMCGSDYSSCYRNRTDIYSDLTNTNDTLFDKSMNKVGGVLDYTIVLGLCVDTVKNSSICEEQLAIEKAKYKKNSEDKTPSWGGADTTRMGWYDAGSAVAVTHDDPEEVDELDENGNKLCGASNGQIGVCGTTLKLNENESITFDAPRKISYTTFVESRAAETMFQDLIYDLEKEAQAKYNAKLTKEQNACIAANNGGIMGNKDIASTYMWAKLRGNTVPKAYPSAGLKPSQFTASNELYGSFCRIRVTLQSDDKNIQDEIIKGADWATTYFAAGDTFTCGSWIPKEKLTDLATAAGKDARKTAADSQPKIAGWMAALGGIGLGTAGIFVGDRIQNGSGTLLKNKGKSTGTDIKGLSCTELYQKYQSTTDPHAKIIYADQLRDTTKELSDETRTAYTKWSRLVTNNTYAPTDVETVCGADAKNKLTPASGSQDCGDCGTYNTATQKCDINANRVRELAVRKMNGTVSRMSEQCNAGGQRNKKSNVGISDNAGKWIGGVVGTVGGAALGYHITKEVLDAQLDKAQQEAIQEFMDNVGSKIRCYIGPDEAGSYGDVISTTIE